jgi:hypothetical protein
MECSWNVQSVTLELPKVNFISSEMDKLNKLQCLATVAMVIFTNLAMVAMGKGDFTRDDGDDPR